MKPRAGLVSPSPLVSMECHVFVACTMHVLWSRQCVPTSQVKTRTLGKSAMNEESFLKFVSKLDATLSATGLCGK